MEGKRRNKGFRDAVEIDRYLTMTVILCPRMNLKFRGVCHILWWTGRAGVFAGRAKRFKVGSR